jgi:MFS family permease
VKVSRIRKHKQEMAKMDLDRLDEYGKKTTRVLFASQSLFSSGNIMLFTISSILAVKLGGSVLWTGMPMTIQLAGSACAAWPLGKFMDIHGRRAGLILGQLCGLLGSIAAGSGVFFSLLPLFLLGIFLIGFARGALDMGRYAAADANPSSRRARAISSVVFGGTVGSIVGPQLLQIIEPIAATRHAPPMSLPWFVVSGFYLVSFALVFVFLRPDPSDLAREIAKREKTGSGTTEIAIRPVREIFKDIRVFVAIGSIICGHLVMYLTMTVTPVFMNQCHEPISSISWVIFAHVVGMYGFSFFVGWLADRLGRVPMILSGSAILVAACLLGPMDFHPAWLALFLFLVGLGWNFCFVTGSTYLSDTLRPGERGSIQGFVDTFVNVAAGVSSLGSGLLFETLGFSSMIWASLVVAVGPSVFLLILRLRKASSTSVPSH